MGKIKTVLNWVFSVVCLSSLPVYGFTVGSILLFIIGIFSLPVSYIKELRYQLPLNKIVTGVILGVLFFVGVLILPTQEQSEDSSKKIETTEISENTFATMTNEEESDSNQTETAEQNITTETMTTEQNVTAEATTTEQNVTTESTTTEQKETTTTEQSTTEATITEEVVANESIESQETYILNTNTHKFHYAWCSSAKQIKSENRSEYTGTRDEVIGKGYSPCGNCNP